MNFIKLMLGKIKLLSKKVWEMFINIFKDKHNRKTLLTYILVPIFLELIIESFGSEKLLGGLNFLANYPVAFFCNTMIILSTLCISLFFKKRVFFLSLISFIWLVLGFCNFVLLTKRVTPFTATDILLWKPAIKVVTKYYSMFVIGTVIGIIVLIIAGIVLLGIKSPKVKYKIKYVKNLIITAVIVAATFGSMNLAIKADYLKVTFDNIANAFLQQGFPYCFANSVVNTGVRKPNDYSSDNMTVLLEEITGQQHITGPLEGVMPNVVFVQLESFFDVDRLMNLELSENPIPNFTKLREDWASGMFSIPTVGAGTANTEFEVLTGMNIDDFGPGEYPYKTVLQSTTCESIAYNLSEVGYATHAIHNNDGTFYQRHSVYTRLGFDTFTSIEYMNIDGRYTYRGWATDEVLTEEIMKCLESTEEKDFVFTVSVEGHGSYPTYNVLEDPEVELIEYDGDADEDSVEYYVNLLRGMDNFIGDLVETISNIDENTIVVFFGDHLPSLDVKNEQLSIGNTLQTEYVIWNNFGYNTEDEDIEAYQLSSKICEIIGVDNGFVNKYHQQNRYLDTYLSGLQNLEYDIWEGKKYIYGGTNPYIATDMKMGVYDVVINDVFVQTAEGIDTDEDSCEPVIIKGENFTEFSVVYVNDVKIDKGKTKYLDKNTIQVNCDTLNYGDIFKIAQAGDDNIVLSYTKEYVYKQ